MKKNLSSLMALLLALVLGTSLTACESESTYEVTTSGDCVITSATMGTLYRILHTTSSTGADSTYRVAVTGALYPLSIDQLNARIFNLDSLPVGTDIEHLVFSSVKSIGAVSLKSATTGQDTTFTYTDSLDCTRPRILTVWASDGRSKRDYRLEVNVHREEADTFRWAKLCANDPTLQSLSAPHTMLRCGEYLYIYGVVNGQPYVYSSNTPGVWSGAPLPGGFDATSVRLGTDGACYALADNGLLTSADRVTWTPVATDFRPDALIAAATGELFAIRGGVIYHSQDNGITWSVEQTDEAELLPVTDVRGIVTKAKTDSRVESIVMTGRTTDGTTVVWRKDIDLTGTIQMAWFHLPAVDEEAYRCPTLEHPSLLTYDGATLMTGTTADGHPAPLYISRDNGRTWTVGKPFTPLDGQTAPAGVSATTDSNGFLWIMESTTGSLWRGRFNRLGWEIQPR